ncbi:MAG: sigma-70 family RNA polymerase sigma factor [Chlorobi bacterium]|nr:sigma-70 family RNA polymerase sigma factor [Chlorobiota bacterium]
MARNYTTCGDSELYTMLSQREHREGAFAEVYRRYGQRIYAYCRKILFDSRDADDALQETFLKFLGSVRGDRLMTNLPAYMLTIARNVCMDMLQQRRPHVELSENIHGTVDDHTVESNEIDALVTMALELLPPQWREAVVMQLYANMSYDEIAAALGVPMTTIRNWVCRGKQRLREILQPYFNERDVESSS